MKRGAAAAGIAALVLCTFAVGYGDRPTASGQAVEIRRDVAYYTGADADPRRHRLDLYLPQGHATSPAVLFLHGGEWSSGDKNEIPGALYENVGRALAGRGATVAIANYRLTDGSPTSVTHPEHARDVARAAAFVRALLVAGGADPVRLYLMGHDAGAHLASLVAANARFLAEHGLGPTDLSGVVGLSGLYRIDPESSAFSSVFGTDPSARLDASPIAHVGPDTPPHLLLYAADDVPGRDVEAAAMAQAVVDGGVPAAAEAVADRDHRGIVEAIGRPGDIVTARVLYFVSGGSLATITPPPPASITPSATPTATPTSLPVAPPSQPEEGPGGASRPHGSARPVHAVDGPNPYRMWVPDLPPADAPLLVVLVPDAPVHDAEAYTAWVTHLARGGAAVVVPVLGGDAGTWKAQTGASLRAALAVLAEMGMSPSGVTAYVGHGTGAIVAGAVAADWLVSGLPMPRALLLLTPHRAPGLGVGPLRRLPRDTLTLVVAAQDDPGFDADLEREHWSGLADIPGAWRQLVLVRTDRHGSPVLEAVAAMVRTDGPDGRLDALDWFGSWKWLDGLLRCAADRQDCVYALGDTPEQRFMGRWGDGVPVREPIIRFDEPGRTIRVARLPIARR